jgi:O-antigen/teichoic acid export membrane protein
MSNSPDMVAQELGEPKTLTSYFDVDPQKTILTGSLRSDFVSKVAETFATKCVVFCLGLTLSIVVARVLGPSGRGIYATAIALTAMGVQFGSLGLHAANTFFVAKDKQLLGVLVANALTASAAIGSVLGLSLALVAFLWPAATPLHGADLALALIGIPFGIAYLLLQNLVVGLYKIRPSNQIEILNRFLNLAVVLLVALFAAMSSRVAIFASIVAAAISAIMCLIALAPELEAAMPSLKVFWKTFAYGCRPYLAAVFGFAVLKADLILVARMLGAPQAGFYSVAVNLSDMIYVLPVTVGGILFPKLSRMSSREEKWRQATKVAVVIAAVMIIICAMGGILSRYVIPALFGARFTASIAPFNWLLPGIACMSVTSVLSAYIGSERIPWTVVWVYVAMSVIDIAGNLIWLPKMGIIGAAKLSSVCYLGCLMGIWFIAKDIAREAD